MSEWDWRKFKGSNCEESILCSNINAMEQRLCEIGNEIDRNIQLYNSGCTNNKKELAAYIKKLQKNANSVKSELRAANRRLIRVQGFFF